ncbi:hypothetical protein B0T14DRAFT_571751 [Immersiella caudata]|uniref:Uncharacterized protein n=1 Tax=Immersiella caudata TaxID=314043 RepID=A0AA39T1X2_9PEZI|nr:hypothetical protein B0T14DRAFT_571751 [Immersiella caudata]
MGIRPEGIVAYAERLSYFEPRTQVFVEQNNDCGVLDEGGLFHFLEKIETSLAKGENVGNLTIFVLGHEDKKRRPNQLQISAELFQRLVNIFQIPASVLQTSFDPQYISRACGLGLYGNGAETELFYPSIITGARCFVYGRSLGANVGFVNIILRPPSELSNVWSEYLTETPASSYGDRHPLQLHLTLLGQLASFNESELYGMRNLIVSYEKDEEHKWLKHNQRRQVFILHRLAQAMRIVAENYTDAEAIIDLLQRANKRLDHSAFPQRSQDFDDMLLNTLSRTGAFRRWALNYADRSKILIDLAFHIATQDISEVNHQDSTSMNTIAIVTLVFLPGTLVCAIFSTVFFDISFDENGVDVLQFSPRLWYFFAITTPLTIAVVLSWWAWKRHTVKRRLSAENLVTASKLRSKILGPL